MLDKKDKGQALYADSAYTGEKQKKVIRKYKLKNKVHEKGYRGAPLTDKQKAKNKIKNKSKSRACIWVYGAKHERIGCKICRNNKSR